MKALLCAGLVCGLSLILCACGPDTDEQAAMGGQEGMIEVEASSWEAFNRLSDEDQLHQATALLIIRYDIDEQGKVTPVVTHRKSRLGGDSPPYQEGDVYLPESQQDFLNVIGDERRHLGDGAVVLFSGNPPQQRGLSIIRDGAIGGVSKIPVDAVLAGFDGASVINGLPAEVLTLEPDLSKGETGPAKITLSKDEKDILVGILERRELRHEVVAQGDEYVVGWIGMDEDMMQVMDEFDAACE